MKYSVIVPVYNVEQQLRRCLDCIVAQNMSNLEVLLVDDGSTDGSGKICDEYTERYDYFKVLHQANKGLSGARKTGLELAQGEWIIFLDSDDYWAEDFFKVVDRAMLRNPADYYKFNYMKVFDDREPEGIVQIIDNELVDLSTEDKKLSFIVDRLLDYRISWESVTAVYRKSIIDKYHLEFIDTGKVFAEDLLFTMNYLLHTDSVYLICNYLYNYYTRENSLSTTYDHGTLLPRLFCLLRIFWTNISAFRRIRKNYYKIYFGLINYHVTHNLQNIDISALRSQIRDLSADKPFRKLGEKIKQDEELMEKLSEGRNWL